jgi:hypothetical protein
MKITDRFRGIYRIYPNSLKENRRLSTCNRLDLQTLGSQPFMPKNLPDHCLNLDAKVLNMGSKQCSSLKCAHAFQCEGLQNNHTSLKLSDFVATLHRKTHLVLAALDWVWEKITPVSRYQHECEPVNLMLITVFRDARLSMKTIWCLTILKKYMQWNDAQILYRFPTQCT